MPVGVGTARSLAGLVLLAVAAAGGGAAAEWRTGNVRNPDFEIFENYVTYAYADPDYGGRSITIACGSEGLGVSVRMAGLSNFPRTTVRWQFDAGPVAQASWDALYDNVFQRRADRSFVDALIAGKELLFEAFDFAGRHHNAEFPLDGAAPLLRQLLRSCRL